MGYFVIGILLFSSAHNMGFNDGVELTKYRSIQAIENIRNAVDANFSPARESKPIHKAMDDSEAMIKGL